MRTVKNSPSNSRILILATIATSIWVVSTAAAEVATYEITIDKPYHGEILFGTFVVDIEGSGTEVVGIDDPRLIELNLDVDWHWDYTHPGGMTLDEFRRICDVEPVPGAGEAFSCSGSSSLDLVFIDGVFAENESSVNFTVYWERSDFAFTTGDALWIEITLAPSVCASAGFMFDRMAHMIMCFGPDEEEPEEVCDWQPDISESWCGIPNVATDTIFEDPDTDGDCVSDDEDNCPLDANPDQIDQDLDGVGNACDDDLDGDGYPNDADNCPDMESPIQTDQDGDGIGDICDNDADGDSVSDDIDNCLGLSNQDQSDSDEDGFGDACDDDDDDDGVPDIEDNCPLEYNPDQSDFDANGEGDACDGDEDGDGIDNEFDLCLGTPLDAIIDADGCSGAQRIDDICGIPSDHENHGQYVSCVAHEASQAVSEGLITHKEKARFVRNAAQKK